MSGVTCQVYFLIFFITDFFFWGGGQNGGASHWSVYYQRGQQLKGYFHYFTMPILKEQAVNGHHYGVILPLWP